MMKKRLSKTLWYGTDVDSYGNPIIPSFTADQHDLYGLHVGELFLHYSGGMATLWTANESGNVVKISGGEGGVDLSPYLLISEFNEIWELRTDSQGTEYIFGKLPVVTQYGITMYSGDNVDIPSIAEGLPFDGRTIWFNPTTNQIEVIGGTGGGSGEGVSNFWDLNGIPSWITNTKPTYSYSEIQGTPDLSVYALASDIPSLSGYATEQWVLGRGFALSSDLSKYIPIAGATDITGEKNFIGGLKVNGSPIVYDKDKKYWKLEGDLLVTGGVTMYGNDSEFTPSTIMDAISVDGTTISKEGGVLKVIGSVGGATTMGSLSNVGSWADSVAPQDRIMYQAANSSTWVAKNLSDLAVGGVTGDYLPLSGGTLTGTLLINSNKDYPLVVKINKEGASYIAFENSVGQLGELGILRNGQPYVYTNNASQTIWHSGNDGSGSGLDADLLDGYDNGSFFINRNIALNANNINTTLIPGCYHTANYSPISGAYKYGTILNFRGGVRQTQFYIPDGAQSYASGGRLFFRDMWNAAESITTAWYEIITSASVGSFNAGSATKLQTARTIWGQSFDGTGNVDGRIRVLQDVASNFTEDIISSFLVYSQSPYGLITRAYNNGDVSLQAQRESNKNETFSLILNPNGGNVGIGITNPIFPLDVNGDCYIRAKQIIHHYTTWEWESGSANPEGAGRIGVFDRRGGIVVQFGTSTVNRKFSIIDHLWQYDLFSVDGNGNVLAQGGITMYSDARKKTILNHVELSLKQIAEAPLIEHYYNSDQNKTTHVGSIAQYWAEMNDWFCKKDSEGYYTMEIQNAALASAISVARELVKFETETDRRIRLLEEENKRLKEEVEQLKWNIA